MKISILLSTYFIIALSYLSAQSPNPIPVTEEVSIQSLLLKEVDALNKTQNIEDYMSCFAPSEDILFGPNKNELIKGTTALRAFAEKIIANYKQHPNKNTWTFSDWKIRINGNSAFVTCLQTTTTPAGKQIEVFKSDYLEKYSGGAWKIVDHRFYHTPEKEPDKN